MTIPQLAAATGLTNGFISQLERDLTSASLSSLARIAAALDVRLGHIVDGTPEGEAQKVLFLRGQEHVLLTSADELRFHVTESRIPPGGSAGEELYSLPADVEIVYVAEGALELRCATPCTASRRASRSRTRPGIRTPGATRRRPSRRSSCGWPSPIPTRGYNPLRVRM